MKWNEQVEKERESMWKGGNVPYGVCDSAVSELAHDFEI